MNTSWHQVVDSARRQHQLGAGAVLDVLLRGSITQPEELALGLQANCGVGAVWRLDQVREDLGRLSLDRARQLGGLPLLLQPGDRAVWGMLDPWDDAAVRKATAALGEVPELVALTNEVWSRMSGSVVVEPVRADSTQRGPRITGPVVDFVDSALRAAYVGGASDVHFECDRQGVCVKLRQDGVLTWFARLDEPRRAEEVISRIKVLSQLDITERRVPQDGRFRFEAVDGRPIDLRVSIMPSIHGEDAVLRLLDKAQLRSRHDGVTLDLLGFDAESASSIRELAAMPHGMLLITGPTGSGKTTTVYAVLSEINSGAEKIVTIEDPVEYELPGVLQIPVNERKGLTFAKGLRSILRHDPDRILVGEIRDGETAEIAVQSALTGHQVFTTVHANNVFDVTGRFRHFGLDMFGFMAALNGLVVQRLVRKTCQRCMSWRQPSDREARWLDEGHASAHQVPQVNGCAACHGSGYSGRMVLAEVHIIDDRFRDLVTGQAPVSSQRAHVVGSGVVPLWARGAALVAQGTTSVEEVLRVVGWR